MEQHILVFKKKFERRRLIGSPNWQPDSWLEQAELKSEMMRRGYIIKEVRSYPVIITECIAAKANWPREEREKRQKQIDAMPTPTVIHLKN